MTETYKDWQEKLPFAIFTYQTLMLFHKVKPIFFGIGMEVVLPNWNRDSFTVDPDGN